jgi:hypothetical protein
MPEAVFRIAVAFEEAKEGVPVLVVDKGKMCKQTQQ